MATYQSEREQLAQLEWLFQQKKFAEGADRCEAVLIQFPASFHIKFLKYKFLRELKQHTEALQLLRQMHAMAGDNIMVVKELADLHFELKLFPESFLYYKKLLFLDSFNSQAQERVKHLQKMLETGVADRLADTKAEFRPEAASALPPPVPEEPYPPLQSPVDETILTLDDHEPQVQIAVEDENPFAGVMTAAAEQVASGSGDTTPLGREVPAAMGADGVKRPPAVAAGAKAEADPYFQTESAAELYFKQGMYREALAIYKSLFEKTGRNDYFMKVKAILMLQRGERGNRVIVRLEKFLQLAQQRGKQIV